MKWLRPSEERLLRRMRASGGYFGQRELPAMDRLVARGIFEKHQDICLNCGMHYVWVVRITERGKIACLIMDVLSHKSDLLT